MTHSVARQGYVEGGVPWATSFGQNSALYSLFADSIAGLNGVRFAFKTCHIFLCMAHPVLLSSYDKYKWGKIREYTNVWHIFRLIHSRIFAQHHGHVKMLEHPILPREYSDFFVTKMSTCKERMEKPTRF